MSKSLELPDSLYSALVVAAESSGTTPVGWIAARLPATDATPPSNKHRSLADLFAGRIGRIRSSGQEVLSEHCGEKFADDLERKRREGHL